MDALDSNMPPRDDTADLDASTAAEIARNKALVVTRLQQKGVHVTEHEDADALASLLEVVERFEVAVIAHGGDLMMDEPPPGREPQPDDARFVLPARNAGEDIAAFQGRVIEAMPTDDPVAAPTPAADGDSGPVEPPTR